MGDEWKAEVTTLLEQTAARKQAARLDLPTVIGDYRAVENYPGWYMRKMKLRQQVQAMALYEQRETQTASEIMQASITLATLLLYRMELPETEGAIRARLSEWQAGRVDLFRPATADEVLDTFDQDDLMANVLTPMGFGLTESAEGNAVSPIMQA